MVQIAETPSELRETASTSDGVFSKGALGWALFEWARNPYVVICSIYVFAPYFALSVAPNPVEGQALIAEIGKWAGLLVAVTAPFLGAAADQGGARKPWLAANLLIMIPCVFALWWVTPASAGTGFGLEVAIFVFFVVGVIFPYTETLHNAMLPNAANPVALPHVSGMGLALGNLASVLLLCFVLVTMALPGVIQAPFIPDAPMFGLDPALHEPSRIVGPICAIWLAIFSIPLFLYTKDGQRGSGPGPIRAAKEGAAALWETVKGLKKRTDIALFLVARMLYADGKTALIIYGGVFAAGVMEWGLVEMTLYGILMSIFAVFGGVVGGMLDAALGPKRAILIEISASFCALYALVTTNQTQVMGRAVSDDAVWNSPVFATAPELAFISIVMVLAIFITAAYASSRTMLARMAPAEEAGKLFGLYAMSGTATVFVGHMMVEGFTRAFESQAAGMASIGILLFSGLLLMLFVKPPAKPS